MSEWKLVPVEPTQEMRLAGQDAHFHAQTNKNMPEFFARAERAAYVYRAMLAAAPHPEAEIVLPPCPPPERQRHIGAGWFQSDYSLEQMQEYARAAVIADREKK